MKKALSVILNLILLTLLQTFTRISIREGLIFYFKYFDLYSFVLDLIVSFLFTAFLMLLYFLIKRLIKGQSEVVYATVLTIIGMVSFYLLRAFGGGFIVILDVTIETIKGLIPIFITAFIYPFLVVGIRKLLEKSS